MIDSELIERVATEVMGWHRATVREPSKRNIGMSIPAAVWSGRDDNQVAHMGMWNPITNDAHMDMVLAKAGYWHVSRGDGSTMASIKRVMLIAILEAVG